MPPLPIAGGIADQMGAIMLAYGVLAALLARERFGIGQEVDASHLGSMIVPAGPVALVAADDGLRHPAHVRASAPQSALEPLPLRRRQVDRLGMLQPDRYWADFCARARPPRAGRPTSASPTMRARAANARRCVDDPRRDLRDEAARRVDARSCATGGDFIFTLVNSVDDLPDDPQVQANDYIVDFDHPRFGPTQVVGIPVRLSRDARAASARPRPSSASTPRRSSPSCSATPGTRSRSCASAA